MLGTEGLVEESMLGTAALLPRVALRRLGWLSVAKNADLCLICDPRSD